MQRIESSKAQAVVQEALRQAKKEGVVDELFRGDMPDWALLEILESR